MKARFLLVIVIILNLMGFSYAAMDWEINEDTTIDGGSYGTVTVDYQNSMSSSVVSITGSDIEILRSYESSMVEVNAGTSLGNVWVQT